MRATPVAVALCAVVPTVRTCSAANWTYTLLTPAGQLVAEAAGLAPGGGFVVGSQGLFSAPHATIWTSLNPASAVDVNPAAASMSGIAATNGQQHVGSAWIGGIQKAGFWQGTTAQFTSLAPAGYSWTGAYGTDGVHQVGSGVTTQSQNRALLWSGTAASVKVLNPPTSVGAFAYAMAAGRQVGSARFAPTYTEDFAGFWSGTASSWTLLSAPAGYSSSVAQAISPDGQTQSGFAVGATGVNWACLWHSTADSFTRLHPEGYLGSSVLKADGTYQAGWTIAAYGTGQRAALWSGSQASFVNLSETLPGSYDTSIANAVASTATDVWVAGYAHLPSTNGWDAIVWHESVPAPGGMMGVLTGLAMLARRRARP